MKPSDLRSKLAGVIAFPVTPFKSDFSLDLDGLRKNLRMLLKQPVCAVVAAAGTGELYSLSMSEHAQVVQATVEEVAGKVPVLAATGFNYPIAIELAQASAKAGVSGILAFPPYYPQPDDQGVLDYYNAIADATSLGMIIYSRDWFNPSPSLVEKLGSIKSLIAWKDGQGDIRRYQLVMSRLGDRFHWIGGAGDDLVPGYYSMGVRTYTSSIANVAPRLSLELHQLASNGHSKALDKLMNDLVLPLYALRAKRKGYEVSVMKSMMDLMDQTGGRVRPPLVDVSPEDMNAIKTLVTNYKPWA